MEKLTSTEKTYHDWSVENYGEYRRKLVRESQRKRREKARSLGLCIICATNPSLTGYSTCQKCYARVRIWQYKKRKKETKE